MNEVPRPEVTGALAKLARLKKRPSSGGTPTQGFHRLPSESAPPLRFGEGGTGFSSLGGVEPQAPGFATLSTGAGTPGPVGELGGGAPDAQPSNTAGGQPSGQERRPREPRRRGKRGGASQTASQPDGAGEPTGNTDQQQRTGQGRSGEAAPEREAGADAAAGGHGQQPPGGRDGNGRPDFAEPEPEPEGPEGRRGAEQHDIVDLSAQQRDNPADKAAAQSGSGQRGPAAGEPARRVPNEDPVDGGRKGGGRQDSGADPSAQPGTGRPPIDEVEDEVVIGEIVVDAEAPEKKKGSHTQQIGHDEALREMRSHREALGLPAERIEDDPRWREAFHEAFVPPEVPQGDPATMPREKVQAWFEERNERALAAAAAADGALPQQDIFAYHQYGRPHENPADDPAVRLMLHLDNPRGQRTPEGDPAVRETIVVNQDTGEKRVKRRPTLEDLNQPDVTVNPDDIARFRDLFPHKAAIYADFLAELEGQQIHEVQVYPKYNAKPKVTVQWIEDPANPANRVPTRIYDTQFVPDPVLTQMRDGWLGRHPGARPGRVVNPHPEAPKGTGVRRTAYRHATERYSRRARGKLHQTPAGRELYYDHQAGKWRQKPAKRTQSEMWDEAQMEYKTQILLHDSEKHDARRPKPTTSLHYKRTGKTGFRRGLGGGFRRTKPRDFHLETDSVAVGRKVENRIRKINVKSDAELTARDVLRARKNVRHAKRAQRLFRGEVVNEAHTTVFPESPHTAQRPHQKERFQGDPRQKPAWETRQQRAARRRVRNYQRIQEFRANQRRYHAANGLVLDLEGKETKIKEAIKNTTVFHFITIARLHSQLVNVKQELRHARAEAFMYHPAIRGIAKGLNLVFQAA